jgi:hypothetical protein
MKRHLALVGLLVFVSGLIAGKDDKSAPAKDEKPLVLSTVANTWQKKMKRVEYAKQQGNPKVVEKTTEDMKKTLDDMTGKKVEGNGIVRKVSKGDNDMMNVELTVNSVTVNCQGKNDPILSRLRSGVKVRISGTIQEFKPRQYKTVGKGATARKVLENPDTIVIKECSFSKPKN